MEVVRYEQFTDLERILSILFLFIVAIAVMFIGLIPKRDPALRTPITVSHGGYESHLDFLEAHGFVTAEERQAQREFERELREHPERFERLTLGELLKREGIEQAPGDNDD